MKSPWKDGDGDGEGNNVNVEFAVAIAADKHKQTKITLPKNNYGHGTLLRTCMYS